MSGTTHPVLALVDEQCLARPGDPAVVWAGGSWTYAGLRAAVAELAEDLARAGLAPGDRVLVAARRDPGLVRALLATWSVGATAVVVDAGHPERRQAAYERISGARWRLDAASGAPVSATGAGPAPAGPAVSHVLFTSGTTGEPAAVAVAAAPLAAFVTWYRATVAPTAADRVALLGGLGHDPLLRDVMAAFAGGGTLVVPPDEVLALPGRLGALLREEHVTLLHCTPALLEFGLLGEPAGGAPLPVRVVMSGGAPLPARIAAATLARCTPATRLLNVYGATETPQVAACAEYAAGDLAGDDPSLPIGQGVAGAEVVLAGELPGGAGDGDADEVVVVSPNLALGYLGDRGDGGRFGADPYGRSGYRAYRTGDRGRRDARELRIAGRLDRQLSVNGYRVAPEEIEAAAATHPAVALAKVSLATGPVGEVVRLDVAPVPSAEVTAREVRAHLRALLPGHAVPGMVNVLAGARLDANHKALVVPETEATR